MEVAERIAARQRSSTRTIYKSKWALFEKWCRENSVDFSTPSVKQISDFFMYLYQDLNRRPSTIDGYRTAIVDTLGPTAQHIAHNADLHRLLSSFHRDRPKSSRNLPKWNLSVVLNELTKAPFEPMKDTDLKHLTLKTAFLLALASGKRRSEIHAWVANKVSNLGQWEKVALFPSSDFIAKNQLAREGSQSVSPVTIPALTTIVDRQFKEDRTLCPVRALRFYLDRTKDLRGARSLLFISFKKGHTSDIRPATLSSYYIHRCSNRSAKRGSLPTCEHRLDGSHCLCLPSNGSPSLGDPKNQTVQLSDHTNSPRLARDALVLGPSAALNRDPTATPGVDNTPQAVPQLRVLQEPPLHL